MASFLQRMGHKPMQKAIQLDDLDSELRAGIWNLLTKALWEQWEPRPSGYAMHSRSAEAVEVEQLAERLWARHFGEPIDTMPDFKARYGHTASVYGRLRAVILTAPPLQALDLLDAIVRFSRDSWRDSLCKALNSVLTRENCGYRFVDQLLVPVTATAEIEAIETALEKSSKAVREHLSTALELLADRKAPDYRNSIKESISAVEAACQAIAGMPKATLGDCLKAIKKVKPLHQAFDMALTRLYGWTSDDGGIRHALTEEGVKVTHADAQFMLVSCSAFTNYLWSVAAESGIEVK